MHPKPYSIYLRGTRGVEDNQSIAGVLLLEISWGSVKISGVDSSSLHLHHGVKCL